MRYGIYNLLGIHKQEVVVRCNNCFHYYYEEITDERNNNSLKILYDQKTLSFYKGCPACKTDEYLTDINFAFTSVDSLKFMQEDNAANSDDDM